MTEFHLNLPLKNEDILKPTIGDVVYFSGEAFTGRSRLHKRVFEEGYSLPFSTRERNVLIHVGPVIIRENGKWKMTSFNLTSSIQVETWGPRAVKEWGLKAIVGKATMGDPTMRAMKDSLCIHATPIGVTPALFVSRIEVQGVHWFEELGSIEAAWMLRVTNWDRFWWTSTARGKIISIIGTA